MSIDEVEATMNFSKALGFLSANIENGIYLSMHGGVVVSADKLIKDKKSRKVFNKRVKEKSIFYSF